MRLAMIAIAALATVSFAAKCNYEGQIKKFETRMGYGKAAKVDKSVGDGVARVQKVYQKIRKGKFTGMTQFAVYGFIDCTLQAVRLGKFTGDDHEIVGEGTAFIRKDGSTKAICVGDGGVLVVDPMRASFRMMMEGGSVPMIPNDQCTCYDRHSLRKSWDEDTGCAEAEDYDKNRMVLTDEYIEFEDPDAKDSEDDSEE